MKASSRCAATLMLSIAGFALSSSAQTYPVVLVNGYQGPTCPVSTTNPRSANDFGNMEALLGQKGIAAVFFDNCAACPNCSLEDLGNSFGKFLANLKYSNGAAVPRVDVVALSMGGLIVRSYMSGIQANGTFNPPVDTKIRKAVFIGTPHFGTDLLSSLAGLSTQTSEMTTGSAFLSRLATWNQDWDDLRGVDALAIIGNGGQTGYDDGVLPMSSGSLSFILDDERTRIIPYCHTNPANFFGIFSCQSGAKFLDQVDNANHLSYQIVLSFLTDTSAWRSLGTAPSQDPYLGNNGGAYVSLRSATDQLISLSGTTAVGQSDGASYQMSSVVPQVFFNPWLPGQDYQFNFGYSGGTAQGISTVYTGGIQPLLIKYGPMITFAVGASAVSSYSAAPGMALTIYGSGLAGSQVLVNGKQITVSSTSDGEVDAVLPTGILGLVALKVQNSQGSHTVNLMIEPAVPSLYSADGSGSGLVYAVDSNSGAAITGSNPATANQAISLFGTGLGETTKSNGYDVARAQIVVTVGGVAATINFAGRTPGYPGEDEIDIQVPAGINAGNATVLVYANNRVSNVVTLPVR